MTHTKELQTFKTTVLGVGPFCIEFPDGEIITTRSEERQRLIAAAPELLEACKLLWNHIEKGTLVRDITKDAAPEWALLMVKFVADLNKVQAAIAKAEAKP